MLFCISQGGLLLSVPTTSTDQCPPGKYKAVDLGSWKQGQPLDNVPKGNWWEVFDDPTLNELESKRSAEPKPQGRRRPRGSARATARVARGELMPNLSMDPSLTRQRYSPNQVPSFGNVTANTFSVPLDLSYEVDLWGRVRRGFESARADAQASLADYYNVLLTLQCDVAQNYFALRSLDAEIATVAGTVDLRNEQVRLVRSRFEGGIGNELDVARAETELATTEAEAASLAHRRAELENAIAILVGENPVVLRLQPAHRTIGTRRRRRFPQACLPTCSNAVRTLPRPNASSPRPTPRSASPRPPFFRLSTSPPRRLSERRR